MLLVIMEITTTHQILVTVVIKLIITIPIIQTIRLQISQQHVLPVTARLRGLQLRLIMMVYIFQSIQENIRMNGINVQIVILILRIIKFSVAFPVTQKEKWIMNTMV